MKKFMFICMLGAFLSACGSDKEGGLPCPPTAIGVDVNAIDLSVDGNVSQVNTAVVFNDLVFNFESSGEAVFAPGNEFDPNKKYSTDCVGLPVILGSINTLSEFNIYSTADYNSKLTAGTSLNEVFSVQSIDTGDFDYGESLTLKQLQGDLPISAPRYFSLILNQAPEVESSHLFYIEFMVDDKQIIIETTELLITGNE
ncbi:MULTISPECIES: hypothetical protein [unclassified Pseudoalteromonas]|uniref:hypothetical protein n=1 Tax=unclassified Pseudoalteromonas TaxID=194690 RepID=UPI000C07A83F|nr:MULTISPECIES: hypothetical protein [unclassified Pseudoalteromonas]MDP2635703.1 hypothetical protein [Pseudoalteromonas sp. 1_MG-2023]PHN91592.1 hypothetical protein CSC79_00700 [Pseudoalteromonas sp. 3D05]